MKTQFFAKASATKNELYIYDDIGGGFFSEGITAQSVADAIKEMTPKMPMDIYINSPGGNVFEGLAIFNQIKRWGAKKTVHIDGIAASIASVIAMAGDEISMASNAMMMIHQPFGMAMGTAEDCRKMADALDKIHDVILGTYSDRSGCDKKMLDTMMRAETWMTADDAMKHGLCDCKTQDQAMKAEFPLLDKFKNTPQSLRQQGMKSQSLVARMDMRTAALNRGTAARA